MADKPFYTDPGMDEEPDPDSIVLFYGDWETYRSRVGPMTTGPVDDGEVFFRGKWRKRDGTDAD